MFPGRSSLLVASPRRLILRRLLVALVIRLTAGLWLLAGLRLLARLLLPGLLLILVESGLLLGGIHRAGSLQRGMNSQPTAALAVALLWEALCASLGVEGAHVGLLWPGGFTPHIGRASRCCTKDRLVGRLSFELLTPPIANKAERCFNSRVSQCRRHRGSGQRHRRWAQWCMAAQRSTSLSRHRAVPAEIT